uniref:O-methyltransferase n=1 Tax=Streptomyces sp. MMG1612 TaxID=1415547 RepID=U5YRA6_9ACTN|nr:O-methyltransferase [Streptomyces sp. MMG1612]
MTHPRTTIAPSPHGEPAPPPRDGAALRRLWELGDYVTPLALRLVSDLGVADVLADGPLAVDELAARTGAHPDALRRALRVLVARQVFEEPTPSVFALNDTADPLRSDHPQSARDAFSLLPCDLHAWAEAAHSLRTGEPAFAHVHGTTRWTYLDEHPEDADRFHRRMRSASRQWGALLASGHPWAGDEHVVDVGGGTGGVLAELLHAHPGMRGHLLDQPAVVEGAPAVLSAYGPDVAERCTVTGGDFFTAVPPGHDTYLLVNVLHDWDDAHALRILANVRSAMPDDGTLLIVEGGVTERAGSASGPLDLHMLVVWGGRERTRPEWDALLGRSGLTIERVTPAGPRWIVVVRPLP